MEGRWTEVDVREGGVWKIRLSTFTPKDPDAINPRIEANSINPSTDGNLINSRIEANSIHPDTNLVNSRIEHNSVNSEHRREFGDFSR